ncbi:hypothetical protein GWK47_004058 [Chionoecetes opilio]|uniref:Uncharacterized protein n=1 Tax=Chionoecetes opilio TaxID=41210 RepID=A0A8J4YU58_CHIOP|nr:hypothetical protein GWK47_004058 [Chionoecetes opilio]
MDAPLYALAKFIQWDCPTTHGEDRMLSCSADSPEMAVWKTLGDYLDPGAVGLTENPTAFKKWMIAGPEQARILTEFERGTLPSQKKNASTTKKFHGLRHSFRFLRQGEKISMGGLECLRGGDGGRQQLMNHPYMTVTVNCKQFQLLERFTVIIYNKTSNLDSVNEGRREIFSQKNRPMEKIPPTQEALLAAHTARSLPGWNLGNQ